MKRVTVCISAIFLACVLCACTEPSPLYGTWSDNAGSKIVFTNDTSFIATVKTSDGLTTTIEGDYTVLLNSLVFNTSNGRRIVSEWDIRGNMLYIDWADETGESIPMTLYKTAN